MTGGRPAGPLLESFLHPVGDRARLRRACGAQAADRAAHIALGMVLAELQLELDLLRRQLEADDGLEPCASRRARVLEAPWLLRSRLVLRRERRDDPLELPGF